MLVGRRVGFGGLIRETVRKDGKEMGRRLLKLTTSRP